MAEENQTLAINVTLEITAASLQTIVETVKQKTGRDSKGFYRVDTADKVSQIISRFLSENDFESYVKDINNYP